MIMTATSERILPANEKISMGNKLLILRRLATGVEGVRGNADNGSGGTRGL